MTRIPGETNKANVSCIEYVICRVIHFNVILRTNRSNTTRRYETHSTSLGANWTTIYVILYYFNQIVIFYYYFNQIIIWVSKVLIGVAGVIRFYSAPVQCLFVTPDAIPYTNTFLDFRGHPEYLYNSSKWWRYTCRKIVCTSKKLDSWTFYFMPLLEVWIHLCRTPTLHCTVYAHRRWNIKRRSHCKWVLPQVAKRDPRAKYIFIFYFLSITLTWLITF